MMEMMEMMGIMEMTWKVRKVLPMTNLGPSAATLFTDKLRGDRRLQERNRELSSLRAEVAILNCQILFDYEPLQQDLEAQATLIEELLEELSYRIEEYQSLQESSLEEIASLEAQLQASEEMMEMMEIMGMMEIMASLREQTVSLEEHASGSVGAVRVVGWHESVVLGYGRVVHIGSLTCQAKQSLTQMPIAWGKVAVIPASVRLPVLGDLFIPDRGRSPAPPKRRSPSKKSTLGGTIGRNGVMITLRKA